MTEGNVLGKDQVADNLKRAAEYVLVIVFGLLPLFFIPLQFAPFDFTKIFFVLAGGIIALILFGLSVLRSGEFSFRFHPALLALWGLAFVSILSALLSGDLRDALVGSIFSIHSALFVTILAFVATIWSVIKVERTSVLRLYMLLAISTIVLVLFHVIRIIFGPDTLTFNVFTGNVSTPIGGWNDLAIMLGLIILLTLTAIEQLPLTFPGRVIFSVVLLGALAMLTVINFSSIWFILGLVSLAVLVYTLTKGKRSVLDDSLNKRSDSNSFSLVLSLIVFVVSVLFVIGGSFFGNAISSVTGISYLEVRPSLEATTDIAREVFKENFLLGVGTNKFVDAWRLYKNEAINPTVFWNTEFNAGNGYISTSFVSTGLLGVLSWIAFVGLFLYFGIRMLVLTTERDRMWYFIGVSSFASAIYIWILAVIYVPGATILMLGAFCTGLALLAGSMLESGRELRLSVSANKRMGFVVTLGVIVIIVGGVSILYTAGKHYAAVYAYSAAVGSVQVGTNIEEVENQIVDAFELSPNDVFARQMAEYQLLRINSLLTVQDPDAQEQQQFQNAFVNGVNIAQQATALDPSEPNNWSVLGNLYSILVTINIEGSYDRALEALTRARDLDPKNPLRYLALAQLEARAGNVESSRGYLADAIRLKPNYNDAYFFLSQLDISTGNVSGAIDSTRAMISIEPNNAARHYQLGVLESSTGNVEAAVAAFERAVALNPDYANARYFLALGYDALGRSQDARIQLERVLELNPGNRDVIDLIATIDTQGSIGAATQEEVIEEQPVEGDSAVTEENGVVTTTEAPDTNLVTPVNSVPLESGETNIPESSEEEIAGEGG